MKREFTDQLKENATLYGIQPRHLHDVFQSPDKKESVTAPGLELNLYTKLITRDSRPFYLLVMERVDSGSAVVLSAFKFYSDLCHGADNLGPLQVLEQLMERFGDAVQVGPRKEKFILRERVPVSSPNEIPLMVGLAQPDHSVDMAMFLSLEQGPPMVADCAVCFCLRTDAYVEWLGRH